MARRRMLAPIVSKKHYIQLTDTQIASGAILANQLVDAAPAPATTAFFTVVEGSVVKAIYCEYWLLPNGASNDSTQFIGVLEKVPQGAAAVTVAQITSLQSYDNKKNILYTTQGVLNMAVDGQGAIPVSKQWFMIPKGKQRMGLGDRVVFTFFTLGTTMRICGFITYKEYT